MSIRVPKRCRLITDPSPTEWVFKDLWPWTTAPVLLGSFLPEGFDGYARLLHPAYRGAHNVGTVRWAVLADMHGLELQPDTSVRDLFPDALEQEQWQEAVPLLGCFPQDQAGELADVLAGFTRTPDRVWFLIWEGYGIFGPSMNWARYDVASPAEQARLTAAFQLRGRRAQEALNAIPKAGMPQRAYFVLQGPLHAVDRLVFRHCYQSPNYWWPEDRSWCVMTEVDDYSTYVAGSRAVVDAVLSSTELEAIEVPLTIPMAE